MKTKNYILSILFLMVSIAITSCSPGKGYLRDRNLEQATLARLDSVPGIQYVGKSYARELDGDTFQTVIIYYATDSVGNRAEYNARVTTNDDCSEIYSWEEMDNPDPRRHQAKGERQDGRKRHRLGRQPDRRSY